jgi:ribosomal protein S18 acetylase RimI-like enzyme
MEFSIRHIRQTDAAQLLKLTNQLGYNITIDNLAIQVNSIIENPNHRAYVAETGSTLLGYVHGFITIRLTSSPFLEIAGLIVSQDHRNMGIGSALINHLETQFPQYKESRVRCNIKRKQAHAFYLNQNFDEVKQQKVFERKI